MLCSIAVAFALATAVAPMQSLRIRDSLGIRIVENAEPALAKAWTVAPEPVTRIGVAAGDPAHELYRVVDAILLATNVVVVANGGTQELRWYSDSGKHIKTVGGTGGGPGEFMALASVFSFPGDSVAAYDVRAQRLSVFDPMGQFVRSERVPTRETPRYPSLVHRFPDGTFLAISDFIQAGGSGPTRVERLPSDVYRYSASSDRMEVLSRHPGLELVIGPTSATARDGTVRIGRNFRAFGRNTTVVGHADGWIVGDNARPELQYWTLGSGVGILARWRVEPQPTTRADIEAYRTTLLERYDDPVRRRRMAAAWSAWPDPPRTKPFFGDEMHVDPEGNVWVRAFRGSGGQDNTWSVLDISGVWLADVTLPSHDRVLALGADRVVVLQRSPMDVEFVSIYRIER